MDLLIAVAGLPPLERRRRELGTVVGLEVGDLVVALVVEKAPAESGMIGSAESLSRTGICKGCSQKVEGNRGVSMS